MGNCLGDHYYHRYMRRKNAARSMPVPPAQCGLENGSTITDSSFTSRQPANKENGHSTNNWATGQNSEITKTKYRIEKITHKESVANESDKPHSSNYYKSQLVNKPPANISNPMTSALLKSSCSSSTTTTQHSNNSHSNAEHTQSISIIPPILQDGDPVVLVAIFDYHSRTDEELSLRKYDKCIVLNDIDPEWWLVEHQVTKARGYVPTPFLAAVGSLEAEDWFGRNISRKDATRLLLLQANPRGTFMVRNCESASGSYSLSIHDKESEESVKHYLIRYQNQRYNITSRQTFNSIQQLIEYYREATDHGLCCRLTYACPRAPPITTDLSYKTKDHWEISRESIELIEKLGGGQFGDVYKAKWNDAVLVAVKTLKQGTMTKDEFLKEARLMKDLNHPKLVKLYAVCSEDPIFIITELMTHGSLLDYLKSPIGQRLSLKILVDIITQIAYGMSYLEKKHYIHRDLAARNILVGDNNVVKVADFGLARMILDSETYEAKTGTKFPIKWTAPEAALMGRFTTKSDVWSFGILVYEVITHGGVPYASMNNTETLSQVDNGYRIPKPKCCPQSIYEEMLKTWHYQPENRPTFEYLSEFFDNFFNKEDNYKKTEISSKE